MPGRDGLGPVGQGPLTGRGLGSCGKGSAIGAAVGVGTVIGYGCRMYKRSRGAGFRGRGAGSGLSLDQEKTMLEERLNQIKDLMGH